jgi:plasmid replication initiation protein
MQSHLELMFMLFVTSNTNYSKALGNTCKNINKQAIAHYFASIQKKPQMQFVLIYYIHD